MEINLDVSIIIVNWNSVGYLERCLASIYRNTAEISFEVIIIDNASYDGCKEMLRLKFPQARFIQSDSNVGFARANNMAFNVSRGRNILFLNPDTEININAFKILYNMLNTLPNAGIVGAKLINCDLSIQTSCIQAFPTIANQFLNIDALRKVLRKSNIWGASALFKSKDAPSKVDAVSGASLMIKRSVFQSVGMFSTDYFMYSEDIDLCYKVHKSGWNTFYIPKAIIVHYGGKSTIKSNVNAFSSIMMVESRRRYFRKTRPAWYSKLYRIAIFIASLIRIFIVIYVWPIYAIKGERIFIERVTGEWTARLRWTLGGEKWIQNYYKIL